MEHETLEAAHDLLGLSENADHISVVSQSASFRFNTHLLEGEAHPPVASSDTNASRHRASEPSQRSLLEGAAMQIGDVGHAVEPYTLVSLDAELPAYLRSLPPFESCLPGQATPKGIMDFNFDWDLSLNDLDIGSLDHYNLQIPFNASTPSTDTYGMEQNQVSGEAQDNVVVRHEAFKNSVWRYLPQSNRDFGAAEQPNLAFSDMDESAVQRSSVGASRRAIHERLHRNTRDRLFALVIGACIPSNVERIASAFPSVELLDGLMQYFLTSPCNGAKAWFHIPTFSPSKLRLELLAAIIAAGAVSAPDIPLRKLGFALHEASRIGGAKTFEDDNTAIRDLQCHQTVLLNLDVGLWSGISRKMEIAESFLQPLVTMLRRGGRFHRSIWKEIVPTLNDNGALLEQKWKEWALQESHLRLVYRVFEHDKQSSMALLKPPLISYAEMQTLLPHTDALWYATTSEAWKTVYLSNPSYSSHRPFPAECLVDLSYLTSHDWTSSVFLYTVWGMIWEYRQMAFMIATFPLPSNNSLVLSSRYQELTKLLEDFRACSPAKNLDITLELMLMHLNASIEDLQHFAGIRGVDEARRAYSSLKGWVGTPSARQALWHAGQIYRAAAEHTAKGLLRGFNAIAVYHAGLLMWGYSSVKRSGTSVTSTSSNERCDFVCLNGDTDTGLRRFVTLDRGVATIQSPGRQGNFIPIENIGQILDSLVGLLKANHETGPGSLPPLVDNLIHLMESLRPSTK
jgi:hypothetical protein